jgi:hypothetical protein
MSTNFIEDTKTGIQFSSPMPGAPLRPPPSMPVNTGAGDVPTGSRRQRRQQQQQQQQQQRKRQQQTRRRKGDKKRKTRRHRSR